MRRFISCEISETLSFYVYSSKEQKACYCCCCWGLLTVGKQIIHVLLTKMEFEGRNGCSYGIIFAY